MGNKNWLGDHHEKVVKCGSFVVQPGFFKNADKDYKKITKANFVHREAQKLENRASSSNINDIND